MDGSIPHKSAIDIDIDAPGVRSAKFRFAHISLNLELLYFHLHLAKNPVNFISQKTPNTDGSIFRRWHIEDSLFIVEQLETHTPMSHSDTHDGLHNMGKLRAHRSQELPPSRRVEKKVLDQNVCAPRASDLPDLFDSTPL